MSSFQLISFLAFLLILPRLKLSADPPRRNTNQSDSRQLIDPNTSVKNQTNKIANNSTGPVRHLNVVTLELPPFMMKRYSKDDNNTVEWYGYCMDFFEELIKNLPYQITYELYQVADNKFGSKTSQMIAKFDNQTNSTVYVKTEKWNGLVGELHANKADIALAPLAVMAERELAVDFTVPFYDLVGIQILLKKPEVPRHIFKFLTVLDGEVWLSIMVAYFVTSFVIFLFDRLSPYSNKNMNQIKHEKIKGIATSNIRDYHMRLLNRDPSMTGGAVNNNILKRQPNNNDTINKSSTTNKISTDSIFNHPIGSSWASSIREVGRKSSIFVASGFDSLLATGASIHQQQQQQHQRENIALNDSYRGSNNNNSSGCSRLGRQGLGGRSSGGKWQDESGNSGHAEIDNDNDDEDEDDDDDDDDDGKPDFGFKDSLWFCITSLTPQGGGEAPMNLSGRIVAGAWWLFCFIIIASYTANLAAFLTVSRLDIPIESLDDLAKQYRIKYAPVEGTAEHTYFERMAYIEEIFYNIWRDMSLNDSLSDDERSKFAVWDYPISDKYTKIWTQIRQVGMPTDHESALERVKRSNLEDGFALLADANIIKHAVMTDCSFKAVGDEFSRKPIALAVRKPVGSDNKFRDQISHAILRLINKRFMEILREKWWTNNPWRVNCDSADESEGVGIENIGGVFIIIGAGVLLSFVVWALERFAYQTKIELSQDLMAN